MGWTASRSAIGRRAQRCLTLAVACALGCSDGDRPPAALPDATSTPTAAPVIATATPARIAGTCVTPPSPPPLLGPARERERDLDLQFHWRAALVCQDRHALEQDAGFRPFENLVVLRGQGHRVLLLLPSLDGATSVAQYQVELSDDVDAELVTAVAIEPSAATKSDGVDVAVAVTPERALPDASALSFLRLSPEESKAGWRELRVDLTAHRGKTVWVTLASRERGDRSGDWLLWGDPRVIVKQPAELHVDATGAGDSSVPEHVRTLDHVPWSEANVFKAYSGFNDASEAARSSVGWVPRVFPWIDSLRLFSSLGGNFGPTLLRDYASQMGHNPTHDASEEQRWAQRYEFFHDGPEWADKPIAERFAWESFDRLMSRVDASGVALHVNLAGVPEVFTGGRGHYHTYHYNEMPVVDEGGWKTYVGEVFAHLATQPWYDRAQFSFFSEPNCRWIASDGSVANFGYQGDAAQYARQYLWTWQAMKPYVTPGQVHLGPFVAEPDPAVPVADNLGEFVGALREEFVRSGEALPPWSSFAFNIYESPQLAIDHFASYKIDAVRRVLEAELPGVALPLRFDEVGIHPLIASAFASAGVPSFDGSRWAAAWHAEMLALLVEQRIEIGSPWLFVQMQRPFASYALLSLATSLFTAAHATDTLALVRREPHAPARVHVRLGSRSADRVGYAWSRDAGGATRVALWQIPRFPASDERLREDMTRTAVELDFPGCKHASCTASLTGYDDQAFEVTPTSAAAASARLAAAALPALPQLRRLSTSLDGRVRLVLRPGEVYLLEVEQGNHADPSLRAP